MMFNLLYIAAGFAFLVGVAHSYLGEKRLISPLTKDGKLPILRGSEQYTAKLIRIAWHLTTVLFWAIGGILILMARDALSVQNVCAVFAWVFLPMGLLAMIASRARHVACLPFLIIGGICLYGALG